MRVRSLAARWIASGHAPYSSQYEFAIAFAWGATIAYVYIERQFRVRSLGESPAQGSSRNSTRGLVLSASASSS